MKEIFKRYLVFVIGLYFLAAGNRVDYTLGIGNYSHIEHQLCIKPE